jgi:hypothetical protein
MWFSRSHEKELKMIWEVEWQGKKNYLAGSAHFFPYSFMKSLRRLLGGVQVVLLEGPLDQHNMDVVRLNALDAGGSRRLREALSRETIEKIKRELDYPAPTPGSTFASYIDLLKREEYDLFSRETEGVKPWMALFRVWSHYLANRGWKYSVDLEVLRAGQELKKEIHYLESIEEQIEALDGIPFERIVKFFRAIDDWEKFAGQHARYYLEGNLEGLAEVNPNFPTRCESIVGKRDPRLFERMVSYYREGGAAAFVGTIHLKGIKAMLEKDGFRMIPCSRQPN